MNKMARAMMVSFVKDIRINDPKISKRVEESLNDPEFVALLVRAGASQEMFDALKETLELSSIEKTYCCDQILTTLKERGDE